MVFAYTFLFDGYPFGIQNVILANGYNYYSSVLIRIYLLRTREFLVPRTKYNINCVPA